MNRARWTHCRLLVSQRLRPPTCRLETASANEGNPTSGAEQFFELLQFHTIEGYRLSHLGQTPWLGYKPHPPGLYPDLTVD